MTKINYLFKFKSLPNSKMSYEQYMVEIDRIKDIIENHRLYVPMREELNDPAEGLLMPLVRLGVCGGGIFSAMRQRQSIVKNYIDKYRILSLTGKVNSFLMWAHYTNNYTVLCFVFKNCGSFDDAKQIRYLDKTLKESNEFLEFDDLQDEVRKALYRKSYSWNYEDEYRIVTDQDQKFFGYKQNELEAIILGHYISKENLNYIKQIVQGTNIKLYITVVDEFSIQLLFIPLEIYESDNIGSGIDLVQYANTFE